MKKINYEKNYTRVMRYLCDREDCLLDALKKCQNALHYIELKARYDELTEIQTELRKLTFEEVDDNENESK